MTRLIILLAAVAAMLVAAVLLTSLTGLSIWNSLGIVITVSIILAVTYPFLFARRNRVRNGSDGDGDNEKKGDKPSSSNPDKGSGGMSKVGEWFKDHLGIILGVPILIVVLIFGYRLWNSVWNEIENPTAVYEPRSRSAAVRGTASRTPLGTECPTVSRGERQTCSVQDALDWTYFETGPQVAGYQVSILPDYDVDRRRPEGERAYSELRFLLDDGTDFRYEGQPPPRMAVAFRAVVRRPTVFTYKMERSPG